MFVVAFLCFFCCSASVVQVKVKHGADVSLHCSGPKDSPISVLKWIRHDLKEEGFVYYYRDQKPYDDFQHPSFRGRVELRDPGLKDGDVSVILRNVSSNDTGTYECHIIVEENGNRGQDREIIQINLKVEDPAGPTKDEGNKDEGNKDEGRGRVGLVAGLGVFGAGILLLAVSARCYFSQKG